MEGGAQWANFVVIESSFVLGALNGDWFVCTVTWMQQRILAV